jgi:hypothetical protein
VSTEPDPWGTSSKGTAGVESGRVAPSDRGIGAEAAPPVADYNGVPDVGTPYSSTAPVQMPGAPPPEAGGVVKALADLSRAAGLDEALAAKLLRTALKDAESYRRFEAGVRSGVPLGVTEALVAKVNEYAESARGLVDFVVKVATGDEKLASAALGAMLTVTTTFTLETPEKIEAKAEAALERARSPKVGPELAAQECELALRLDQAARMKRLLAGLLTLSADELLGLIGALLAPAFQEAVHELVDTLGPLAGNPFALGEQLGWWSGGVIAGLAFLVAGV